MNRIRVAKYYDWKGIFEDEINEKEEGRKSILKEKEKENVGMQTRSKKVVIDEVLFGSSEEN